jgi:orotidine-5'-phosphate decarboxylase
MAKKPYIYCAIDTPDIAQAKRIAGAMQNAGCGIKLGLEFFCTHGFIGVESIRDAFADVPIFLDLKFHDIPNTVAGAVRAVTAIGPTYMTLHASGGTAMMQAAQDAVLEEAAKRKITAPQLLAVTVLTSLDDPALDDVGQLTPSGVQVIRLARLAAESGVAGVVCAGPDIMPLRALLDPDFILMVPGIRPAGSQSNDQKRIMTPADAVAAGATHLVIGRPITESQDPGAAAMAILDSIALP